MTQTIRTPQGMRIPPRLPAAAMRTYRLLQPLATHFRPATCKEVDCLAYRDGWGTTVITGSDDEAFLVKAAAGEIDGHVRKWVRGANGPGFTRYTFAAEQTCFGVAAHRVPLEREPLYLRQGGDWRGNPRREHYQHSSPADWVEDFAGHQQKLADRSAKG